MKTLLLQISDFHFKNNSIKLKELFKKMIETLENYTFDDLLLFICGDITFSGQNNDFEIFNGELKLFLHDLKKNFNDKFNENNIYIVPGNHDICYDDNNRDFSEETKYLLNNYMCAFKDMQTINDDGIACYKYNDNISIMCINSCYGSNIIDGKDDYGKHGLTTSMISKINSFAPSNYNIIVMHHGLNWFDEDSRKVLSDYFKAKATCILVGHEHIEETQFYSSKVGEKALIIRTPATSDGNLIENLGFNICLINIDDGTMDIDTAQYKFGGIKIKQIGIKASIRKNCNLVTELKQEFEHSIKNDDNGLPISEYFVFEGLRVVDYNNIDPDGKNNVISDLNEMYAMFNNCSKIAIRGTRKSGKTTLAKIIFNHYYNKAFYPLLIDLNSFSKKISNRVFTDEIQKEYNEDISNLSKVVILDNVDNLKERDLIQLLNNNYMESKKIIMLSSNEIDYDIKKVLENYFDNDAVLNLNIEKFTYNKRSQLIKKYSKVRYPNIEHNEANIKSLNDGLSNNIMHFAITPSFIIKCIVEYNGFNNMITFNNYDKIYEADIVERINSKKTNREETKVYIKLLSEIAYYLHRSKKRNCTLNEISNIVNRYCNDYDIGKYDITKLISELKLARILRNYEENEYGFIDNSDFAYFIANKIKDIKNPDEYKHVVNEALDNVFSYINSDIILFLILLKTDDDLVELLISKICSFYGNTPEFSFENLSEFFNESNYDSISVNETKPKIDDYVKEEELKEEKEKKFFDDREEISIIDPYGYTELDKTKPDNQLIISLKYLEILSKTLSSFYLDVDRSISTKIIEILYKATNITLFKIFRPIENNYSDFKNQFCEYNKDKYVQHTIDEKFKNCITLMMIIYTYLIYSMVAELSINKNTINSITNEKWHDTDNHLLQVSMFYLENNDFTNFAKTIRKLKNNDVLFKSNILKLIVRQFYLQNRRSANNGEEASLYDEFFKNGNSNAKKELIKNKYSKDTQ